MQQCNVFVVVHCTPKPVHELETFDRVKLLTSTKILALGVQNSDNVIRWISQVIQRSQRILFDALCDISAQANDSCWFAFDFPEIHVAISSFNFPYIFHLLNSSLSSG